MESAKKIPLRDLRVIINQIFDHIEKELDIDSIELLHDYYNDLSLNAMFDIEKEPINYEMGQLYDDWEFLEGLKYEPECSVSLMFDHVAPILRYIAYRIGQ